MGGRRRGNIGWIGGWKEGMGGEGGMGVEGVGHGVVRGLVVRVEGLGIEGGEGKQG